MKRTITEKRMEEYIRTAQEWKASGMTQAAFAAKKGVALETLKYRIRRARENAPKKLTVEELSSVEFAKVPTEHVQNPSFGTAVHAVDPPVLMVQSAGLCLQVTGQVNPHLLKTAMEVMLGC